MTFANGNRAVFLDRDGTINIEKNYVHRIQEWEWISGSTDAIRTLNKSGFLVIVVSNQSGIARGKYSPADVNLLHSQIVQELAMEGGSIDDFYFCPHHPEYGSVRDCACRKPKPGLLMEASAKWRVDLSRSWMIGDKLIDVQAGMAAGAESILVRTGHGEREKSLINDGQSVADSLLVAVNEVILPAMNNTRT